MRLMAQMDLFVRIQASVLCVGQPGEVAVWDLLVSQSRVPVDRFDEYKLAGHPEKAD